MARTRPRRARSSSGSEYSGFEGAVTYLSGFQIVHRYAYVVVPADGEPSSSFPTEARYVGEHGTAAARAGLPRPPRRADRRRARGTRAGGASASTGSTTSWPCATTAPSTASTSSPFDVEFDLARAVKSEAELESVRDSRADQRARLRDLLRRLRAGEDGGRGDGGSRGVVRRRGLRPPDR